MSDDLTPDDLIEVMTASMSAALERVSAESHWTGRELLNALRIIEAHGRLDAPLWSEGCDCYGAVTGLTLTPGGKLILTRADREHIT